jgi:hypothetical protein
VRDADRLGKRIVNMRWPGVQLASADPGRGASTAKVENVRVGALALLRPVVTGLTSTLAADHAHQFINLIR